MNITRHLYLSTAVRVPDDVVASDPAADPPAVVEPVAADPPQPDPAPAADPPAPPTIPMRVFQQRVSEETNRRQAVEGRLTAAETKAANLQAIIDRMQSEARTQPDPAAPARQPEPAARAPAEQPNLEEAVRREVDSREQTRSINDVISKGVQEFTQAQWDEKAAILAALGAATPEFVQDVIAVDAANAHRIIFQLAEDPGKAADLASMNVRQRTAELTRMSMAEQAKTPVAKTDPDPAVVAKTPVSKAPAPTAVTRASSETGGDIDPTDPEQNAKMDDKQFEKWYKDTHYKKVG